MLTRLTPLAFFLFASLAVCQQSSRQIQNQQRAARRIEWQQQIQDTNAASVSAPSTTVAAETVSRDAQQLSQLTASVYSQLQQLQKGALPKDLDANLKAIEKLSKKLRREIE